MMAILLVAGVFLVSAAANYWFSQAGVKFLPSDTPNQRSLHRKPVPRAGGIAISVAIYTACLFYVSAQAEFDTAWWLLCFAVVLVAGISLLDDYRALGFLPKIIIHAIAAGIVVVYFSQQGLFFDLPMLMTVIGMLTTAVAIIWSMNSFNFMDGSDGLAAVMAIMGFGSFALIGWLAGDTDYTLMALVIMSGVSGFLLFNFPRASIFLGDAGSVQLGLVIALFSLWGINRGHFDIVVPLILFSPFLVDTVITLLRRIVRRERFWQAHCSHFYQRLIHAGWSHRRLLLAEASLMLLMAGVSVGTARTVIPGWEAALAGVIVLYFVLIIYIHKKILK